MKNKRKRFMLQARLCVALKRKIIPRNPEPHTQAQAAAETFDSKVDFPHSRQNGATGRFDYAPVFEKI